MNTINRKWWLGAALLLCLVPFSFGAQPHTNYREKAVKARQMPEGGSAITYLLGASITCLGAMVIRSRAHNSTTPR